MKRPNCAIVCLLAMVGLAPAATIDFEVIKGAVPFEGMAISNQFQPYHGISFRREAGASVGWPVIARLGAPQTAFDRNGSAVDDTPIAAHAGIVGQFFLTDTVGPQSSDFNLILDFEAQVSEVSGYLIDVDGGEVVVIRVYADGSTTNALETLVLDANSPGTGDGAATFWSIARPARDIRRVEIDPFGIGIGYDGFSSDYEPPPASPAVLSLRLHPGITIEGDVDRPYRVEYADKIDRTPTTTNWHLLTNIFLPRSPYFLVDPTPASPPERYYRALSVP
jgi:hypothetical protein